MRLLLAYALVVVTLLGACSSSPSPVTQIVVTVDADETLKSSLTSVRLVVEGATGRDDGSAFALRLDQELTGANFRFPLSFPIAPLDDEATRVFRATVIGRTGATNVVTARLISGFVRDETRYVSIVLANECSSVECSETQTCERGRCVDAFVEPESLPTSEVARDAGIDGAMAGDAGAEGDAAFDLAVPPTDAAVDPCEGALSTNPTWTVSTTTRFDPGGDAHYLDVAANYDGLYVLSRSDITGDVRLSHELDATWEVESVATGDASVTGAIAIDPVGTVVVSYSDVDGRTLHLDRRTTTGWTRRTAALSTSGELRVHDLYVDPSNRAYVTVTTATRQMSRVIFDATSFTRDTLCTSCASDGYFFLPTGDAPEAMVAGTQFADDNGRMGFSRWNGTTWNVVWELPRLGTNYRSISNPYAVPSSLCGAASVLETGLLKMACLDLPGETVSMITVGEGNNPIFLIDPRTRQRHLLYAQTSETTHYVRHSFHTSVDGWSAPSNIAEITGPSSTSWSPSEPVIAGINQCGVISVHWTRGSTWRVARRR